ncbi:Zinc finger protein 6 [Carex littledalei]|uniref:Zinc finger protein 6 n=1 Tax=Carex littledalei TaxID=544730 RepID=A0A833QBJ2_9POAL|nr:Zinc finger protein 6 [Carex littledalei]
MEDGGSTARKYPCNFCDRVFITAQALGGHQNSHRRERDSIKMSNEETQFQPIQATPTISPFSHSTAQTNNCKIRDVPMPYDYNRHHPRKIYVPNHTIPKEFYYHPYANRPNTNQNGLVPWKNLCFGSRYPLNSMAGHPTDYANTRSMSRYPFIFSRGESSQGYQSLRLLPQNYDFFPQIKIMEARLEMTIN